MSNYLINEANIILKDLRNREHCLSIQVKNLSGYDGWLLKPCRTLKSGVTHYSAVTPATKSKRYLGNDLNEDVINIKRLRYVKEAASIMNRDIQLLEELIKNYIDTDYKTINSRLPKIYRTDIARKGAGSLEASLPKEALEWKENLEKEKAKYPPYRPEQLKHPAMNGTLMRSKSEVIIANMMLMAGIPFVYEAPMFIEGQMLLPDFKILSMIDLKTVIIIEHQGMVFADDYANKFIRSVKQYLKSEWIPNQNLFFTFDNAKETLDVRQVTSILRKYIQPDLKLDY